MGAKPKKQDEEVKIEDTKVSDANVHTYVGGGEDSPRKINFMGKQEFVRGQPTKITDPAILAKVKNHPCFTQEEVTQEDLHEMDEAAAKEAGLKRGMDLKTSLAYKKQQRQLAPRGEKDED